ncbi:S-adenosyl-L-methionine-dependent methyltransferase [Syncephalis plumigaleata]|nr:S-adenosyl-L-methionine-dependent methyltransferase [Syncephalis plumigaleata]
MKDKLILHALRNLNSLSPLVLAHSRRNTTRNLLCCVQQSIRQQLQQNYLTSYSTSDEDINVASHHRGLREATAIHFPPVSPLQGRMLRTLASITGAKRILELGCFTGQSALWLAEGAIEGARRRGMDPASVEVITCERDEAAATVARDWIAQAKLEAQITVILGQADTYEQKPFDLIFLDANKSGYILHLNIILERNLLTDYGFIIADNVLFRGDTVRVANELGELFIPSYVASDPRVESLIWPLFDGLNIIQKRLP